MSLANEMSFAPSNEIQANWFKLKFKLIIIDLTLLVNRAQISLLVSSWSPPRYNLRCCWGGVKQWCKGTNLTMWPTMERLFASVAPVSPWQMQVIQPLMESSSIAAILWVSLAWRDASTSALTFCCTAIKFWAFLTVPWFVWMEVDPCKTRSSM